MVETRGEFVNSSARVDERLTIGAPETAPASGASERRLRRLGRVVPAAVPGLVMLVFGLVAAERPVLSWDEVATADVAKRSAGQIWHLLHTIDAVFAPYYLFMHVWTSIAGTTVLDLRLPSILAMAGAVALAGELGRRLFNPTVGLVAGILLCLIPNTSRYADEARPYAFACLFSVIALLLLYRLLDHPGWVNRLWYGAAVLLLGLSHLVALTMLGGHLAIVALRGRRAGSWRPLLWWAVTVAIALALLLPLAYLGVGQRNEQLYWVPPITARVIYAFPGGLFGSVAAAWLLLGLVVVAMWRPAGHLIDMVAAALVPTAAVALVSLLGPPFWVARYLLVVLAPTAIVAAAGLHRLAAEPGRSFRVPAFRLMTVCALFAVAAIPGQLSVRGRTSKNGSDFRSAAAIIQRQQQPGDDIVYTPNSRTLRAGIDYYLRHDPGRPRDVLLERSAASRGNLRATEYTDGALRIGDDKRVWMFVAGVHQDPASVRKDLEPVLRSDYQRVRLWHIRRGTLALFVRRPGTVRTG
jgi:mannosyltransferase